MKKKIKYVHTNIIAKDWRRLSRFYQDVFGCRPVPPARDQQGDWLEKGTGVRGARLEGVHLLMPGWGPGGPTLEIFHYEETLDRPSAMPNHVGYGHLAFEVYDVKEVLKKALDHGAQKLGEISKKDFGDRGILHFIYIRDPESNIIELQNWS
jgi:catechol 2,3-dioxygenase-like lactoylglutathione lyase family enzyme